MAEGRLVLEDGGGEGLRIVQAPSTLDWALYAALAAATSRGGSLEVDGLEVDGAASRRALSDAGELVRAWASMLPGEARALTLTARTVAEASPWAPARGAIIAAGADGTLPDHLPEAVDVRTILVWGTAGEALRARAEREGWRLVALRAEEAGRARAPCATGSAGFFHSASLRAAALHLLGGHARLGLLAVEHAHGPRLGAPASPAQAAAFLSGGAVEVVPLLPLPLAAPASQPSRRPVTVHLEQCRSGQGTRRSLILEGLEDSPAGGRATMRWEMPDAPDLPEPAVLDQMVAAAVLPALVRGQDLRVRGPLSRLAAVNLPLLAAARAAWGVAAPRGPISVTAETILDGPGAPPPARAALTFSGGADGFFSLLWRTGQDRPRDEAPLQGAVLSLGFDIPLSARQAFEAHRARLAPLLERRGVALPVVHTNARALGLAPWEPSAMPMIASALAQFSHLYGVGLLGGGRAYPQLSLPAIQAPLLDRALSGGWFSVATDGSATGRSDKIALLARHPDAMASLRVCYDEGSGDFSRNCCACPKCLRTMLNFRAVGIASPACFERIPPLEDLVELPFWKHDDVLFVRDVLDAAARHGTAGAWTARLAARADAWRLPPATLSGRLRAKAVLWAGRMAEDPLGTPGLAVRKLAARLGRRAARGRKRP